MNIEKMTNKRGIELSDVFNFYKYPKFNLNIIKIKDVYIVDYVIEVSEALGEYITRVECIEESRKDSVNIFDRLDNMKKLYEDNTDKLNMILDNVEDVKIKMCDNIFNTSIGDITGIDGDIYLKNIAVEDLKLSSNIFTINNISVDGEVYLKNTNIGEGDLTIGIENLLKKDVEVITINKNLGDDC